MALSRAAATTISRNVKRAAIAATLLLAACMPTQDRGDRARELVFADAFTPASLDPALVTDSSTAAIEHQLYEQLTRLDGAAPGQVAGALAETLTRSPDGLRIAVTLRPGHRFSDGTSVDANAVAYSFARVKAIGRAASESLSWLDRVVVTGPRTLLLVLKQPYAPATQLLAQAGTSIVSPAAVRAHAAADMGQQWLASHSAGSGPYRLVSSRPGESVVAEANPFAVRRPRQFTQLRWIALPDEGVRRLLLERGDVDMVSNISSAFVDRYRALPGVAVRMIPGGASLSFLVLNTRKGPLADPHLRAAVAAAIDYDGLRHQVLKGNVIQVPGFLAPGTPAFDPDEPTPHRDLERARALAKASGYDGRPLRFLVQLLGPVAEFTQSNLKAAGIAVELEKRSPAATDALQRAGDFDVIYSGWTSETPDSAPMLEALYTKAGLNAGTNPTGWSDPAVDALIARALASTDDAERAGLERAIDQRLRTVRPLVMLFSANPVVAYRRDIGGVALDRFHPGIFDFAAMTRGRWPSPEARARKGDDHDCGEDQQ